METKKELISYLENVLKELKKPKTEVNKTTKEAIINSIKHIFD